MKKLNKLLAVMLAAVTASSWAAFTACDDSVNEVDAYCIFDRQRLIIDIDFDKAYAAGMYTNFTTDSSLEDIKGEIDGMALTGGTLTTTLYSNSYLLVEYNTNDGGYHVYMVVKYDDTGCYFECPSILVKGNWWLIPYHLLGDGYEAALQQSYHPDVELGCEYTTSYTMQDFYNFYQNVAKYEATIEGDTLTLHWETDEETYIVIQFTEKDGGQTGVTINLQEGSS